MIVLSVEQIAKAYGPVAVLESIDFHVSAGERVTYTLDVANAGRLMISMPYSPSRVDLNRFQNLRPGDRVRIAGVPLNNSRVELRQFY